LVGLYSDQLNNKEKALHHEDFLKNNIRGEVVVVTGLGKSGENEIITYLKENEYSIVESELDSEVKKPQFSKLSSLKDHSIDQKTAVHVSGALLSFLPNDLNYKFIVAEREMDDLVAALHEAKSKIKKTETLPLTLFNSTKEQLEKMNQWLNAQPNAQIIRINFEDLNNNEQEQFDIIYDFLGK
jgi:hypothetical protein